MNISYPNAPCPVCGIAGLHSCPGAPLKKWTEEELQELDEYLSKIFDLDKEKNSGIRTL
ncbi:MAG TPA: hypothetical protein VFM18_19855 [Methanosarcina sp.]|nr:hypothetical protein [Methanosarcina sp.]